MWAAFELNPLGARSAALGAAGCALPFDAAAVFRNPALIAIGRPAAGFTWSQQFGLPELSREAVCATISVRNQPLSVRAGTLGNELYRESEFGLIAARSLRPEISAGLEISSRWLDVRGYPVSQAWAVTGGVLVKPLPSLSIGGVWRNLNSPKLSGYQDKLPESLQLGIAANIGRTSVLVLDILQEKSFPAEFRFGAETKVLPGLQLRVGARAEPVRPSAGFEVNLGKWGFSYAGDLHPDLGASHEIGLEFRFKS